jgi:NDP-sugar pyrophosphorylase family protein
MRRAPARPQGRVSAGLGPHRSKPGCMRRSNNLPDFGAPQSGATVKQSILLPGSYVGDGAYLEGCIVGSGYDVRAGEQIWGGALIRPARSVSQRNGIEYAA